MYTNKSIRKGKSTGERWEVGESTGASRQQGDPWGIMGQTHTWPMKTALEDPPLRVVPAIGIHPSSSVVKKRWHHLQLQRGCLTLLSLSSWCCKQAQGGGVTWREMVGRGRDMLSLQMFYKQHGRWEEQEERGHIWIQAWNWDWK